MRNDGLRYLLIWLHLNRNLQIILELIWSTSKSHSYDATVDSPVY